MYPNTSNSTIDDKTTKFDTESIILIIVSAIICVTGFIANVVIAVVILKVKRMQTTTNWLVFNLTVADLIIICVTIPYNMINPFISWPFGYVGCKYLIMPTIEHFASVCVLTHTAISLARYVNIRHPRLEEVITHHFVKGTIFFIWAISFLVLSAPLMGILGNFVLDPVGEKCTLKWISPSKKKTYRVLVFLLTYIVPMVATGYSYRKIHVRVHQSLRNVHSLLNDKILTKRRRKSRQLDSTLMFMYTMFAALTLPFQAFLFLLDFEKIGEHFNTFSLLLKKCIFDFLLTLFYAQILSNPLVLLYKGREYRKSLSRLKSLFCIVFPPKNKLSIKVEGSLERTSRSRHFTNDSIFDSKKDNGNCTIRKTPGSVIREDDVLGLESSVSQKPTNNQIEFNLENDNKTHEKVTFKIYVEVSNSS